MKVRGCDLALPIPEAEYLDRQARLDEAMDRLGLKGISAFGPDVFYLSGYLTRLDEAVYIQARGGDRLLLTGSAEPILTGLKGESVYCDEVIPLQELSIVGRLRLGRGLGEASKALSRFKGLKFGFAGRAHAPADLLKSFEGALGALRDCSEILWDMRKVKSQRELEVLKAAYYAISDSLNEGIKAAEDRSTRGELAGLMADALFMHGVEGLSESFSVGSGFNVGVLAFPYGARDLVEGKPLTLDVGCSLYGYKTEAARTIVVGWEADTGLVEDLRVLHSSAEAAFQTAGPAAAISEVCKAAWNALLERYPADRVYGSLHSTGIEPREPPLCRLDSPPKGEALEEDMTVSLELYASNRSGEGGTLKMVDGFLVTEDGAERLVRGVLSGPQRQAVHHNYGRG